MSQEDQAYSVEKLYEESFQIEFNWKEILPQHVFHFHDLFARETNSSIDLQMGTILPFVASCVGPHTKGLFLTRPSVLNLFWPISVLVELAKAKSTRNLYRIHWSICYLMDKSKFLTLKYHISLERVSTLIF